MSSTRLFHIAPAGAQRVYFIKRIIHRAYFAGRFQKRNEDSFRCCLSTCQYIAQTNADESRVYLAGGSFSDISFPHRAAHTVKYRHRFFAVCTYVQLRVLKRAYYFKVYFFLYIRHSSNIVKINRGFCTKGNDRRVILCVRGGGIHSQFAVSSSSALPGSSTKPAGNFLSPWIFHFLSTTLWRVKQILPRPGNRLDQCFQNYVTPAVLLLQVKYFRKGAFTFTSSVNASNSLYSASASCNRPAFKEFRQGVLQWNITG